MAYVDESYSDDWYYMAALLVDGPQAASLSSQLDEIVSQATKGYGLPSDVELHGFELFQGKKDWEKVSPRSRIGIYNKVFQAIAKNDAKVILRGVHKRGLEYRYSTPDHPHGVVLQHLLERIDEYAETRNMHALVIADEVGEQHKHRADLSTYQSRGTKGYRRRKLTRILDTLHFAPSHASRLVQAADMIVYFYRRIVTHREVDPRATKANMMLLRRILNSIVHKHCWMPDRTPTARKPRFREASAGSASLTAP